MDTPFLDRDFAHVKHTARTRTRMMQALLLAACAPTVPTRSVVFLSRSLSIQLVPNAYGQSKSGLTVMREIAVVATARSLQAIRCESHLVVTEFASVRDGSL